MEKSNYQQPHHPPAGEDPPQYNAGSEECSLIDGVVEVVWRRDVGGSGER